MRGTVPNEFTGMRTARLPDGSMQSGGIPTPAGLGVKGGEARRSAALVGWPSYPQITVAAGGTTRKPP